MTFKDQIRIIRNIKKRKGFGESAGALFRFCIPGNHTIFWNKSYGFSSVILPIADQSAGKVGETEIWSGNMQKKELDGVDKKILNILMLEAKRPLKDIAEVVFLSIPAVAARIEKLEREGYIQAYHAQVNETLTGFPTKAFIQVDVPLDKRAGFYVFAKTNRQIVECSCVAGEYSMILKVCCSSMEKMEEFVGELQQYGKAKAHVVFSTPVEHRGIQIEI